MGRTRFDGPVFGAKHQLFTIGPVAASTGSSAVFAGVVVPRNEDWYLTDASLHRASTGSTNLVVSFHDDSTLVGSVGIGGSSVVAGNSTQFTPDSGELGARVAGGSVLTVSHSSHAGPNAGLTVAVSGYVRFAGTES
jgi:hypothetical protein